MIYHIVGLRISSIFIGVIKMDYLNRSRIGLYVNSVFPFINTPVTPGWRPYCASTATENGSRARHGRHKRGMNVVETW